MFAAKRTLDEILDAVTATRSEIAEIRTRLDRIEDAEALRSRLDEKEREIERLSEQGLHVLDLLHEARARISRLEHGGS
jgi:chromosome segregation ATPase